jgi:hypothetical protein
MPFTCCTLAYSKKLENLRHAVALFAWHFNFMGTHSAHGMTPAQAAKLAENPMTMGNYLKAQSSAALPVRSSTFIESCS